MTLTKTLAKLLPGLQDKLNQAGIIDTAEDYIKKILFISVLLAVGFVITIFLFLPSPYVLLLIFIIIPLAFLYFAKYVDVKIQKLRNRIDEEIVFAGRFLIIELESGIPIDKAIEGIHQNYRVVGKYFGDILDKVYLGTSMTDAINEVLLDCPSPTLRRILWQLLNSLQTGSDVAPAIGSVIDQIVKEQQIAVKEYGKKLNPMAMFYMMVSVIIPSLGTTMLVVLATFLGLNLSLTILLGLAGFIGFVQFMFLSIIKSSRPPIST